MIQKLNELTAVIAATAIPQMASFRRSLIRQGTVRPEKQYGRSFLLSDEELATLFHPATKTVGAAGMHHNLSRQLEPPDQLPIASEEKNITRLGRVLFRSRRDLFGIRSADRRHHLYMVGKTGMGKSPLLQNMITSDIHAGRGVALIDPHGDLAKMIIRSVPKKRFGDVVIFDPADTEYPIAYNPLDCTGLSPTQRTLVASGVLEVFKKLFAESFHAAARMEDIFRNAFLALVEVDGSTLLSLPRLLRDETFRTRVAQQVQNNVVKEFWLETYPDWNRRYRGKAIAPVENKLRALTSNPLLQGILGQSHSKLNLQAVMDEGKILIVNLSKGNCGEDASNLLGSLLVTSIQQAVMSRSDTTEENRRDFYLYIDEFQNFATPAFATILSEARKYRLNLVLAHQYLGQLDLETRRAVFGNVGSFVSFALGTEDAELMAAQLGRDLKPDDLVHLPRYRAYVGLLIDGKTSDPFLMQTLKSPEAKLSDANFKLLRKMSRERYGVDTRQKHWGKTSHLSHLPQLH